MSILAIRPNLRVPAPVMENGRIIVAVPGASEPVILIPDPGIELDDMRLLDLEACMSIGVCPTWARVGIGVPSLVAYTPRTRTDGMIESMMRFPGASEPIVVRFPSPTPLTGSSIAEIGRTLSRRELPAGAEIVWDWRQTS